MRNELPTAPVKRIMKKADNTMNISKEAVDEMKSTLEDYGGQISRIAIRNALRDKGKTVMKKDIEEIFIIDWVNMMLNETGWAIFIDWDCVIIQSEEYSHWGKAWCPNHCDGHYDGDPYITNHELSVLLGYATGLKKELYNKILRKTRGKKIYF